MMNQGSGEQASVVTWNIWRMVPVFLKESQVANGCFWPEFGQVKSRGYRLGNDGLIDLPSGN